MLKFVLFGAGFWAQYQLASWREVSGAECIAICDPVKERAEALANRFGIANVFSQPEDAIRGADFADIVTPPHTHPDLVRIALSHRIPILCQKPLAESLAEAEALASEARNLQIPLLVHENWRWQTPIRALKAELETGAIGLPFRARLTMVSGFPVFDNQPFLKNLKRFVLADMGVHILDTARFLFGEAQSVYCQTRKVQQDIAGEDAATVMTLHNGVTVITELGYPQNFYEQDRFPETLIRIEGERGSIELTGDFWLRTTTREGTTARRVPPKHYDWADPAYDVVHASLVPCLTNLLEGVRGGRAETTAEDNLKTLRIVEGAYLSAERNETIKL